jgi:hypothetical protein
MEKEKLQSIIILLLGAAWIIGAIIATFDGNVLLRVTTPMVTLAFGWLFAQKATE